MIVWLTRLMTRDQFSCAALVVFWLHIWQNGEKNRMEGILMTADSENTTASNMATGPRLIR